MEDVNEAFFFPEKGITSLEKQGRLASNPIFICGPIFHSQTIKPLFWRWVVFKVLSCCDPPSPGKAIKALFLLHPELCLRVSIGHQGTKDEFQQQRQKQNCVLL